MQNENNQHLMEMQNINSQNLTKMQNENSLKLTALELHHEDRKEAILKIDEILKKGFKNYPDFEKELKEYLDSSSGLFLPQALRQSLKQEADEVHKLVTEFDLELNGPSLNTMTNGLRNFHLGRKWIMKLKIDYVQLDQPLEKKSGNMFPENKKRRHEKPRSISGRIFAESSIHCLSRCFSIKDFAQTPYYPKLAKFRIYAIPHYSFKLVLRSLEEKTLSCMDRLALVNETNWHKNGQT